MKVRRKNPPLLKMSPLTDTIYIVTRYTVLHEYASALGLCTTCRRPFPCPWTGKGLILAHEKTEVTLEMLSDVFLVRIPEADRDKDEFELVVTRTGHSPA